MPRLFSSGCFLSSHPHTVSRPRSLRRRQLRFHTYFIVRKTACFQALSLSLSPPRFSLSPCVSIFLLLNFNSFPFVFRRRNCRDEVVGATEGRGKKIKPTLHHRRCHKPYINVTKRFPSLYFDKKII